MVFVTDDDYVVSGETFALYDPVDFQDEGTGDVYVWDAFLFQFIVDWLAYAVGADHYDAVLLIVVRGVEVCFCDDLNDSGFQVCYYFFVVDDRPQGEDWFLFSVDEFVDFVHGSLNSEAEAGCFGYFYFHYFCTFSL